MTDLAHVHPAQVTKGGGAGERGRGRVEGRGDSN